MLTRISLIVAIVAGLAVAGLNFVKVKEKITTLMSQLASETQAKQEAQADAAATKKTLAVTKTELESTKTELASTQEARDKAVAEKEAQTKRATKLAQDLSKSQQERGDLQAQLAQWSALGLTADQIRPLQNDLKKVRENLTALTETNRLAGIKINNLKNRLAQYEDENYRVELPVGLVGKVLVADPKWDFVVLNIGEKQGALENGVMLVNRNGRLVAKVQIRSLQPDRCIANVLPNWKLGDVMEGDQVIP